MNFKLSFLLSFLFLMTFVDHAYGNVKIKNEDPNKIQSIKVGSTITKNLKLKSIDGKELNLSTLIADKPSVIVFYRGGWCPYCNLQLQNLRKISKEIKSLGFQLLGVSPDSPEELNKTIGKNKLTYTLLSDSKMNVAANFGIAFKVDNGTIEKYKKYKIDLEKASGEKHKLLPVPSVFVVNKKGKVLFSHSDPNYKVRLDEKIILSILKTNSKEK